MDDLDLTLLPAAVSPLVAGEVAGAPRRCRVLAAFPTCLYLDLGAHERVLAVLASDAVALPIGLRLALPSSAVRWGVESGAHVVVGEGRVRLPRADVVAARLLRPARVRPAPRGSARDSGLPEPGVLGDLAHDLTAEALAGRSADPGVRGLVGVGRGLTPSGDDALCGVLLTLAAVDAPPSRRALSAVRTAVRGVLPWTTSLSAALLVAAGAGYAVPDVARLVTRLVSRDGSTNRSAGATPRVARAVAPSSPFDPPEGSGPTELSDVSDPTDLSELADLVDRVLAIGHTSGRDLLSGVSGALRAVDAALEPSPRPEPGRLHRPEPQEGLQRG
ncbi:DUF2877 domain-containing protein [Terrabacter sp. LjRoot27]|uniref:oxamate carbamoyltransferase subunit AllH family protein n=1 Tax=Terrabacter sp. LjRoot27 TaxID=3342306 RepID=UPI003ECFEC1B